MVVKRHTLRPPLENTVSFCALTEGHASSTHDLNYRSVRNQQVRFNRWLPSWSPMIERTIGAGILVHNQQDVSETGPGWEQRRLACVERLHQVGPVPVVELTDSHSPERRPVCVRHCWRIREEPEINWILIQYRAALKTPIWGCGTAIVCQQDAVNLEHTVTSGVFIRPPLSPRGHWHTEIYPDGSSWSVIYSIWSSKVFELWVYFVLRLPTQTCCKCPQHSVCQAWGAAMGR